MTTTEFAIERVFDAPRSLVWKVHADAAHLAQWWGPKGFTWVSATLDFRPGGLFHYCMRAPTGQDMWGKFAYREIVEPERIVLINSFSDKDGATVRAPFAANFPLDVLNVLTFAEVGGRTKLSMRGKPLNASEDEERFFGTMHASMNQGFTGTFDQLDAYLTEIQSGKAVS